MSPGLWRKRFGKNKYLVLRRDGSVPDFEWFVLASSDPAAGAALRHYAHVAEVERFDPEYVADVRELAERWETELESGDTRIGDPDARPHRKDHPAVVAALGEHRMEEPTD